MKLVRPLVPAFTVLGLCAGVVAAFACDQQKAQGASAAASNTACSASVCPHGAKGASTAAITAAFDHCSGRSGASATAASMSGGACTGKNAATAGANCSAHAATAQHMCSGANGATASAQHTTCTYCHDLDACEQEMRSLGAVVQVVPLKNGVMYVYTTDPARVRAVQSAMARHKEAGVMFASAGEDAKLCDNCRALRGAAASGKLTREVVNIDGGCLTLMTSNDPAVVARIHELAGVNTIRAKS